MSPIPRGENLLAFRSRGAAIDGAEPQEVYAARIVPTVPSALRRATPMWPPKPDGGPQVKQPDTGSAGGRKRTEIEHATLAAAANMRRGPHFWPRAALLPAALSPAVRESVHSGWIKIEYERPL